MGGSLFTLPASGQEGAIWGGGQLLMSLGRGPTTPPSCSLTPLAWHLWGALVCSQSPPRNFSLCMGQTPLPSPPPQKAIHGEQRPGGRKCFWVQLLRSKRETTGCREPLVHISSCHINKTAPPFFSPSSTCKCACLPWLLLRVPATSSGKRGLLWGGASLPDSLPPTPQ